MVVAGVGGGGGRHLQEVTNHQEHEEHQGGDPRRRGDAERRGEGRAERARKRGATPHREWALGLVACLRSVWVASGHVVARVV